MKLNKLVLIFWIVKIKLQIKYLFSSDFYSLKLNNILYELNYILTIEKGLWERFEASKRVLKMLYQLIKYVKKVNFKNISIN